VVARGTGWGYLPQRRSNAAPGVCQLGAGQMELLYHCWAVFTLLKRGVFIDLDRMSFFSALRYYVMWAWASNS
jgi:hypothetical protein